MRKGPLGTCGSHILSNTKSQRHSVFVSEFSLCETLDPIIFGPLIFRPSIRPVNKAVRKHSRSEPIDTPLHSEYTESMTYTTYCKSLHCTRKQRACEATAQFCCGYVYPVLTLAVYSLGFIAIHEVFQPSGKFPLLPTVEIRLSTVADS